ncbi:hypothetical protein PR048_026075 [Dryococelus australis]|uniref:Uncharacterized protein n=1 Tax=Dryococelus australis TaxID=614101 RepID=A0ABQ9GKD0_9NEOP|nr:hypothetical protein PR048_026075 [Dryococelus australis]
MKHSSLTTLTTLAEISADGRAIRRRITLTRLSRPRIGRRGRTEDPRENPPTSGIIQHDSYVLKCRSDRAVGRTQFALASVSFGATVAERLGSSPPTQANRAQSPTWSLDGLSWGSPVSPPLHSGTAPYSPRLTLISSQEHIVKSRPNLFTHSPSLATGRSHELSLSDSSTRSGFSSSREKKIYHSRILLRNVTELRVYRGAGKNKIKYPARTFPHLSVSIFWPALSGMVCSYVSPYTSPPLPSLSKTACRPPPPLQNPSPYHDAPFFLWQSVQRGSKTAERHLGDGEICIATASSNTPLSAHASGNIETSMLSLDMETDIQMQLQKFLVMFPPFIPLSVVESEEGSKIAVDSTQVASSAVTNPLPFSHAITLASAHDLLPYIACFGTPPRERERERENILVPWVYPPPLPPAQKFSPAHLKMEDILNVEEPISYENAITNTEIHVYESFRAGLYIFTSEIRISIQNHYIYTLPSKSSLRFRGTIKKITDASNPAIKKMARIGILHLINRIAYLLMLNGVKIDQTRDVGITCTINNYLSGTANDLYTGIMAGWVVITHYK